MPVAEETIIHAEVQDATPRISASTAKRMLLAFLLIGFMLRLWLAVASPRIASADEIFQTQEPAHRLAFGYGIQTWEWREGIRSWVFPAFLAVVMKVTSWMGAGSSGYLFGIRLVLSLLSLSTIVFSFTIARRLNGEEAAILAAAGCAIWYSMVDLGPRALSEAVATHALLPGIYLGFCGEESGERRRMFLSGLLCGLAACLRVQYAPAIGFALVWFCYPAWRRKAPATLLGLSLPAFGFGAVDWATWSYPYPYSSYLRYFWFNAVEHLNALYGTMPWHWYVTVGLPRALGPLLIFAAAGAVLNWRRSQLLVWMVLIIVTTHSAFAYKEERYLYAVIPIGIILAATGTASLAAALRAHLHWRLSPKLVVCSGVALAAAISGGVLLFARPPASSATSVRAFERLSREPNVCGVGITHLPWAAPGGYTHLHHDVPIIAVRGMAEMNESARSFNALVARGALPLVPRGFTLEECWGAVCLYERPGLCAPAGANRLDRLVWNDEDNTL